MLPFFLWPILKGRLNSADAFKMFETTAWARGSFMAGCGSWWSDVVEWCGGVVWLSGVVEWCGGVVWWSGVME